MERFSTTTTLSVYRRESRNGNGVGVPAEVSYFRDLDLLDATAKQDLDLRLNDRASIGTGVELRRLRSSWAMTGFGTAPWPTLGPSVWGSWPERATIDSTIRRAQAGGWVQPRVRLRGAVDVEPGLRVDWNSMTGETSVQPRLRVAAKRARGSVWAGFSTLSQTPGHETMEQGWAYYDLTGPEADRLRNERGRQVVAGFERRLGRGLSLRAEAYARRFDRLLAQRQETDVEQESRLATFEIPVGIPPDSAWLEHRRTAHAASTGRGRAVGLELLVRRDGPQWSGSIAYALSRSERELDGLTAPFDYDRTHALSLTGSLKLTRRIVLAAATQLASGYPITPSRPDALFFPRTLPDGSVVWRPIRNSDGSLRVDMGSGILRLADRNTDRLPYYGRTDVRATFSTLGRWEFYGEVINLFNRENFVMPVEVDGFPGKVDVYMSHERIPSFGLRVRF